MDLNHASLLGPIEANDLKHSNGITFKIIQCEAKESQKAYTTKLTDFTKIRMDGHGDLAKIKPITMHTAFVNSVEKGTNHPALKYKYDIDGKFMSISFSEYYRLNCMAAKSFMKLGLEPRNSVCVAGHNAPPWHISYFGSIFSGGVCSGVYVTNTAETCTYIINNCSCQIAVVGSVEILKIYISIVSKCPTLKAIVQYYGITESSMKAECKLPIYNWEEFLKLGSTISDQLLVSRLQGLVPNECCSLIYTSGTTGNPKGVMMSHDNLLWTGTCLVYYMQFRRCKEDLISYLPLSHVAAQMCDIVVPILCQVTIYFAQHDALKGTLGKTLKEVHPTYFIGVPRVFEKIMEQMKEMGIHLSSIKKSISAWAKNVGLKTNLARMEKSPGPYGFMIANCLIFKKVQKALGFDKCLGVFSAAAPLSNETVRYFASLDIVICEIYGMSECSGPQTIGFHKEFLFGSVGKVLSEFQCKLDNKNELGEGEICMNGRHVFMGYLEAEEKTKEIFDSEYWLHSGDVGRINDSGYLFITGRIKEIIITAGGENIAPVPIEETFKANMPLISNALVIGDKRKYLVMLLTIKCVAHPDTQFPTEELTPAAKRWCESIGYNPKSVSSIILEKNPLVTSAIDAAIKITNESAVSRAAYVQKWVFLPCDFSVSGGELGPTMKVKRSYVANLYPDVIEKLYQG